MKEKTWDMEWTKIANIAKKEEEGSGQVETRKEGDKDKEKKRKDRLEFSQTPHVCFRAWTRSLWTW